MELSPWMNFLRTHFRLAESLLSSSAYEIRQILSELSDGQLHLFRVLAANILKGHFRMSTSQKRRLVKGAEIIRQISRCRTHGSLRKLVVSVDPHLVRSMLALLTVDLVKVQNLVATSNVANENEQSSDCSLESNEFESVKTEKKQHDTVPFQDRKVASAKRGRYQKITCHTCNRVFYRSDNYRLHSFTHCAYEDRPYACQCGRKYTSPSGLKRHSDICG